MSRKKDLAVVALRLLVVRKGSGKSSPVMTLTERGAYRHFDLGLIHYKHSYGRPIGENRLPIKNKQIKVVLRSIKEELLDETTEATS